MVGRKLLIARRNQSTGSTKKSKDKSKGARWSKGHSCVSNPSTTKHREQASSMFLHPMAPPGSSLLTVKNVNTNRGNYSEEESDGETSVLSDLGSLTQLTLSDSPLSILTSASSVKSLASGWSQVSHKAFEKFLRKFKGDFIVHKDMLSILGAASEVISDAGGMKNETEFFATFMSLLDSCPPDQYQPIISLVCIIIGKVSHGVLQLRFGDIYPKIGFILSHGIENDDELLIRTTIEAFTKLMKAQDKIDLNEDKLLEGLFYSILKCSLHEKPRVRRKVRQSVQSLIACYNSKHINGVIPKIILGWILDQLAYYPTCESKVVADALTLLVSCWSSIQKMSFVGAKKLYENVLRVMSSGDVSIIKIGFSFFVVVFQNNVTLMESDPEDSLASKLIVALWELQPDCRNTEAFTLWLSCVLLGMVRSHEKNSKMYAAYFPQLLEKLNPVWLTNSGKDIIRIVKEYLPHIITANTELSIIESCFQIIAKNYLVLPPNPNVLQLTECILESLTEENFTNSAKEVFLQLTPLKDSPGVNIVLGKFIKTFGVENLWTSVDASIRWNTILPLLNENLSGASIFFWKKEIFSRIGLMGTQSQAENIWKSLTGFCRNPKDPQNFPAEVIGKIVNEKEDLRLIALATLRQFVDWTQCNPVAVKYSKNYLPLLFNLYIQEKSNCNNNLGHADAIGITIQKYLSVCEQSFVKSLLEKAIIKLAGEEKEIDPVYDIIAFLSFHTDDSEMQDNVLNIVARDIKNSTKRKFMYRIMTYLAKNPGVTSNSLSRIQSILKESKGETKSNAAAIRLECINIMTEKNSELTREFLLEVILNLISVNAKAKRYASQFIVHYCSILMVQGIEQVADVILTGLKSQSSLLISSTTYFTFLIYKKLRLPNPNFEILKACINNLLQSEDALVWKHSLSYINLCLSIYKTSLGPLASSIGPIAGDSKYPRKEINKMLARMIQIFGTHGLKAVLPNSEDPKMSVRIKNLSKKLKKMKEEKSKKGLKKTLKEDEEESEEENEDFYGREGEGKTSMVIKEGLVNFLDPREMTDALINNQKPASSKPENEFRESADGKIIIGALEDDENEDDSIDEKVNAVVSGKRKWNGSKSIKSTSSMKSARSHASSQSIKSSTSRKRKNNSAEGGRATVGSTKSSKRKKFKSAISVSSRSSSFKFRK